MLRPGPVSAPERQATGDAAWRVSCGTAGVLGLTSTRQETPPTTAYLMLGDRCQRNCAFCAQARESAADLDMLSRVHWPPFAPQRVLAAIQRAEDKGLIGRSCLQVTVSQGYLESTRCAIERLAGITTLPICACALVTQLTQVDHLLAAGAQRVTLALDAAVRQIYARIKGGSWERTWRLLTEAAERHPGHVGTHLIVGLGETEREMARCLQRLIDRDVTIGLFAFTPLPGTPLVDHRPPALDHYRRIQAANWLMRRGEARVERMRFDAEGRIVHLGHPPNEVAQLLGGGDAFRTAGCPDCNRPYYNERPSGPIYNYPRPLSPVEAAAEVRRLVARLA